MAEGAGSEGPREARTGFLHLKVHDDLPQGNGDDADLNAHQGIADCITWRHGLGLDEQSCEEREEDDPEDHRIHACT